MSVIDLPRWSVTDLHESLTSRSFRAAVERATADTDRLIAACDSGSRSAVSRVSASRDDCAVEPASSATALTWRLVTSSA